MLKIYPETKIYAYCPAGVVTGGVELLHQLADRLNNSGREACIVYCGEAPHVTPDEYKGYNVRTSETIEDREQNIVIYCETMFTKLHETAHCQRLMWWLSIDNFYKLTHRRIALGDLWRWRRTMAFEEFFSRLGKSARGHNAFGSTISFRQLIRMGDMHGYQSEYARQYLSGKGVTELCALKDYIHTDYFTDIRKEGREDIVLYNPLKGYKFTRLLLQAAPDIRWVPIQGMTRSQIAALMQRSKLYIDFGNHPGKDRLPREAAMNGLCIVTGRQGAAGYFEDIAIDDSYKFRQRPSDVAPIIEKIRYILHHYPDEADRFDSYRAAIRAEKAEFEAQIDDLFELRKA